MYALIFFNRFFSSAARPSSFDDSSSATVGMGYVVEKLNPVALITVFIIFLVYWVIIRPVYWRQVYQLLIMKLYGVKSKEGPWSVADVIEAQVDTNPGKVQFTMCETEEKFTIGEMDTLANKIAHWTLKKGLKQQDSVAIYMQNHPDFVSFWMGFAKVGVSIALLNINVSGESLLHSCNAVLKDTDSKIIIVDIELADRIHPDIAALEAAGVAVVFWKTSMAPKVERASSVKGAAVINDEVRSMSNERPGRECRNTVTKNSAFFFIFTSGSTGLPKACKITHFKVYGAGSLGAVITSATPSDNFYVVLPLYHSAASLICVFGALRAGASIFLRRKFSASKFSHDCVTYKINCWQYIGELCRYLVVTKPSPLDKDVRLKVAFGNGLRPEVWNKFKSRYNVQNIVEYYAATEGNVVLWNSIGKCGALGYLPYFADVILPVTLLRTDPEDPTIPLRDSKTGLCIRCNVGEVGLMVMPIDPKGRERRFDGYTDPKATSKKILTDVRVKGDKCFNTGDLLSRDAEGFFYWSDRVGDTFRWKGENCSTTEVETVFSKCDGIYDCCVYGVAVPDCDGRAGMAIIALTVDAASAGIGSSRAGSFDVEKVQQACAVLPAYARPMFLRIKLEGEIPQTNTYKHKKALLASQVNQNFERYFDD